MSPAPVPPACWPARGSVESITWLLHVGEIISIELFEEISLFLGIGGLVLYMLYVMYKLSAESGAGRFGTLVIFLTLGLGIFGFAAKSVIQVLIEV